MVQPVFQVSKGEEGALTVLYCAVEGNIGYPVRQTEGCALTIDIGGKTEKYAPAGWQAL